jgi:hypothetical protein
VEDLLFERLDRMQSRVEPEIVLQDLYFIDRVVRPIAGPEGDDYRIPFLGSSIRVTRIGKRSMCTRTFVICAGSGRTQRSTPC